MQSMYKSLLYEYDYEVQPDWVSHAAAGHRAAGRSARHTGRGRCRVPAPGEG